MFVGGFIITFYYNINPEVTFNAYIIDIGNYCKKNIHHLII